ncbi:MAG: metal-dependent phosphohydrolase [Pseudomonadota bacterium]
MFNPRLVLATTFGDHLADTYAQHFAGRRPEYAAYLRGGATLILQRIANTTALYHDAEHTMMVTLVGQEIIRGRLLSEALTPEDWLHYIVALLVHDIGFVRGICKGDGDGRVVINRDGDTVAIPESASDAVLAPYHVDRAHIYIQERFGDSEIIDADRVSRAVDFTRFPVPQDPIYRATDTEPALVRAADLIGQLGDPFYLRKIRSLYHEFEETGAARQLGYSSPSDLERKYPEFFWTQVRPVIGTALEHLDQTVEGKHWIAQLYNQVFQVDHQALLAEPTGDRPEARQLGGLRPSVF